MDETASRRKARILAALAAVAAFLLVLGFYEIRGLYYGFDITYGRGLFRVHPIELYFYLWFLCFAVPAGLLLAAALGATQAPALAHDLLARFSTRRRAVLGLAALLLFAEILWIQVFVLQGAPIADDENTYIFIAQTLLEGRLVNPSPGDVEFFSNQFVILDETQWWGKYPIGHPLFLAAGEAIGVRDLIVPLLTCASLPLAFLVGRRIFSERVALAGALLLLLSPHFVFTGATELSQPTLTFLLLLALWALLRAAEAPRPGYALLCGAALGLGLHVRPLPALLFIPVLAGYLLFVRELSWRDRARLLLFGALPVAAAAAAFLLVNLAQTGDAFTTGYQVFHGKLGIMAGTHKHEGIVAGSLGAALLRQSFWLFGFPLAIAAAFFARRSRPVWLLWALVAAEYAYRILSPKAVVASTGPIYVTEIVPLLSLLCASGLAELGRRLRPAWLGRHSAAALAGGGLLVSLVCFVPIQVESLHRSGRAYNAAYSLLEEWGAERALVFADFMVPPKTGDSWAYYPPNPSPDLSDDVLFVRYQEEDEAQNLELWRRRFPDRPAFVYYWKDGFPRLHALRPPAD